MKIILLPLVLLALVAAAQDFPVRSCSTEMASGGCGFYLCREETRQSTLGAGCGWSGYDLGYGLKYCEIFKESEQHFSPAGRLWLNAVRQCLMHYLDVNVAPDAACSEIKRTAIGSHSGCYLSPGEGAPGICELPQKDWAQLMRLIKLRDADPDQVIATQQACARKKLESSAIVKEGLAIHRELDGRILDQLDALDPRQDDPPRPPADLAPRLGKKTL